MTADGYTRMITMDSIVRNCAGAAVGAGLLAAVGAGIGSLLRSQLGAIIASSSAPLATGATRETAKGTRESAYPAGAAHRTVRHRLA